MAIIKAKSPMLNLNYVQTGIGNWRGADKKLGIIKALSLKRKVFQLLRNHPASPLRHYQPIMARNLKKTRQPSKTALIG
jgi:hypothetical protein